MCVTVEMAMFNYFDFCCVIIKHSVYTKIQGEWVIVECSHGQLLGKGFLKLQGCIHP